MREDGEQRRDPDDTDCGKHRSGTGNTANRSHWSVEAAVEEDENQRDGAQPVRKTVVLERYPADSLGTCKHPDD